VRLASNGPTNLHHRARRRKGAFFPRLFLIFLSRAQYSIIFHLLDLLYYGPTNCVVYHGTPHISSSSLQPSVPVSLSHLLLLLSFSLSPSLLYLCPSFPPSTRYNSPPFPLIFSLSLSLCTWSIHTILFVGDRWYTIFIPSFYRCLHIIVYVI